MNMRFIKIIFSATIILCFAITSAACEGFVNGDKTLSVSEFRETMFVGETQSIVPIYSNRPKEAPSCLYMSEDDGIANVSKEGTVLAVSPGTTVIHIQDKENSSIRTSVAVTVSYETVSSDIYSFNATLNKIDNCGYDFWIENEYIHRYSNWDILDIANDLLTKSKDDYVFSEVYEFVDVKSEKIYVISDWSNADVQLSKINFDSQLIKSITSKYVLDSDLGALQTERATAYLNTAINNEFYKYQGEIKLSELPEEYEYRVYIVMDFDIAKCVHYYAHGTLGSIADLITHSFKSLMDTYTYTETNYEITNFNNARIVIEKRPK